MVRGCLPVAVVVFAFGGDGEVPVVGFDGADVGGGGEAGVGEDYRDGEGLEGGGGLAGEGDGVGWEYCVEVFSLGVMKGYG